MKLDALGLKGGLIVSCQAGPGAPLHGPAYMAALARAAEMAGAAGIRADGPLDIAAIRGATRLPVIGIYKIRLPVQNPKVYITPTFESAAEIARLGTEIIALHVLPDYDREVEYLKTRIRRIKNELGALVMADIATVPDAEFAVEHGVDLVATTSARYAYPDEKIPGPPIDLIRALTGAVPVPVIAEGHFKTPQQCIQALEAGAYAVVVGTALTAPEVVMAEFVHAIRQVSPG
jgi:putative N-acetylmannosamine-6-phosphate epimerase